MQHSDLPSQHVSPNVSFPYLIRCRLLEINGIRCFVNVIQVFNNRKCLNFINAVSLHNMLNKPRQLVLPSFFRCKITPRYDHLTSKEILLSSHLDKWESETRTDKANELKTKKPFNEETLLHPDTVSVKGGKPLLEAFATQMSKSLNVQGSCIERMASEVVKQVQQSQNGQDD